MPITDDQLRALLREPESDFVERKESLQGDSPTKIREAICAFANDLPNRNKAGVIIVGARDDGTLSGLKVDDRLLQTLASMKDDGQILPLPTMTVSRHTVDGGEVAVIEVLPHATPPVQYRGRIWIRVGPRRAIASANDERVLNEKRRFQDRTFDIHPLATASLSDLRMVKFKEEYLKMAIHPEVLEANERTDLQRLAALKMISTVEEQIPTVLGILVLGRAVQDFIPGAWIQFLRIDGTDLSHEVIDNLVIEGTVDEVIRRAEEKITAFNRTSVDFKSSPVEVRRSVYPILAVEQFVRNAVLHRAYEGTNAPVRITFFNDRLEIRNPGGPHGAVTPENFGTPGTADYRNPNLAQAMRHLGLVQQFGAGIASARRYLAANGSPPPEFTVDQASTLVTLRPAPGV